MYKILIRKGNSTRPIYYYYQVSNVNENEELVTSDYETDDIGELSNTVKNLLELFKLSDIVPIKALDVEVLLDVVEE